MEQNINTNNKEQDKSGLPNKDIDKTGMGKSLSKMFQSTTDTFSNFNKLLVKVVNETIFKPKKSNIPEHFKRLMFDYDPSNKTYSFNFIRSLIFFGFVFIMILLILKIAFANNNENYSPVVYQTQYRKNTPSIDQMKNNKYTDKDSIVDQLVKKHDDATPKEPFKANNYIKNEDNNSHIMSTEEYAASFNIPYKNNNSGDVIIKTKTDTKEEDSDEEDYIPTLIFGSKQEEPKTTDKTVLKPQDNIQDKTDNTFKFKPFPGLRVKVKLEYDFITVLNQKAIAIPYDTYYKFPPNTRFYGNFCGNYEENVALCFDSYSIEDTKISIKAIAAQDDSTTISADKIGELDIVQGTKAGTVNTLKNILPSSNDLLSSFLKNAGSSVLSSVTTNNNYYNVYKIYKDSTFYVVFLPE